MTKTFNSYTRARIYAFVMRLLHPFSEFEIAERQVPFDIDGELWVGDGTKANPYQPYRPEDEA